MGTSRSKPDAPTGSPLIPPWADQDPAPPEEPQNPPALPDQSVPDVEPQHADLAPPRRYYAFRLALGRFASSGDLADARVALGHWARTSTGGGHAGAMRVARAARTGGAALASFARAGASQPPIAGSLDVRSLAGLPVAVVVERIVDAFCPTGIVDEDIARLAIGEALTIALAGPDTFDPNAIDANAVRVATLTFVAELVFISVAGDVGAALAGAPSPLAAVQRESDIRSLVREVTDAAGTPILAASGNVLTPAGLTALVSQLVEVVQTEMAMW